MIWTSPSLDDLALRPTFLSGSADGLPGQGEGTVIEGCLDVLWFVEVILGLWVFLTAVSIPIFIGIPARPGSHLHIPRWDCNMKLN